jgi:hypothetical protein
VNKDELAAATEEVERLLPEGQIRRMRDEAKAGAGVELAKLEKAVASALRDLEQEGEYNNDLLAITARADRWLTRLTAYNNILERDRYWGRGQ